MAGLLGLLVGLAIFEGLPAAGFRWMEGHVGMLNLIRFVYPLVVIPAVCLITIIFAGHERPSRKLAVVVSMAMLMPQAAFLTYQDIREYPPLPENASTEHMKTVLFFVFLFFILACIAGLVTPPVLRVLTGRRKT
jgi:hypothetical protein